MRNFYEKDEYIKRVSSRAYLRFVKDRYIVNLLKNKVVLELGCGSSPQTHLGKQYIGLDISLKALKKISDKGNIIQADMTSLPLKDESVEAVITVATLEHSRKLERVLLEIIRVLKIGGIVVHMDAWNVPRWRSLGLSIRSFSELKFRHKIFKLLVPILETFPFRVIRIFPHRVFREVKNKFKCYEIDFHELRPNYNLPEASDADASVQLDSHALALFYKNKGFTLIKPKDRIISRLLHRGALIARKDR